MPSVDSLPRKLFKKSDFIYLKKIEIPKNRNFKEFRQSSRTESISQSRDRSVRPPLCFCRVGFITEVIDSSSFILLSFEFDSLPCCFSILLFQERSKSACVVVGSKGL